MSALRLQGNRLQVRTGFTLVELLVVIAIIGILVALLLPAIQAARESARRSQCVNNLKNIGLAVHNFTDSNKSFPTGGQCYNPRVPQETTDNGEKTGKPLGHKKQAMSWAYQILPYLEEGATFGVVSSEQNLKPIVVPIYVCPSRRIAKAQFDPSTNELYTAIDYACAVPGIRVSPASTNPAKYNFDSPTFQTFSVGTLNTFMKVFNGGTTWPATDKYPPANAVTVYEGIIVRTPFRSRLAGSPGAVSRAPQPTSFAKVVDGTSNTFMIAEKFVRSDVYDDTGELHYSDDRGWSDGWDADTVRLTGFAPLNDGDATAFQAGELGRYFSDTFDGQAVAGSVWNVYHFGSPHTAGINAVFADGSVRTLSFDINLATFNALATRNGEETLDKSGI